MKHSGIFLFLRNQVLGKRTLPLFKFTNQCAKTNNFLFYSGTKFVNLSKLKNCFKTPLDTTIKKPTDIAKTFSISIVQLYRLLNRQFYFYSFQKLRRSRQVFNFYSEQHFTKIFENIFKSLIRLKEKRLALLLGVALLKPESISDEEIEECASEVLNIRTEQNLQAKYQRICHQELAERLKNEGWEIVVDESNFCVFRRVMPNSTLYEYKVFGSFFDIPPKIFYDVQLDTEYRKKWDKLVVKLEVIDKHSDGSEVIHWVMDYPFPMYKREYVFLRKSTIDEENNLLILINRSTEHHQVPDNNNYVRVNQYSSKMVIRPHKGIEDIGFDYILTYFDNPNAAFPRTAYKWMASYGVNEFVVRLHKAALDLQKGKKCQPSPTPSMTSETQPQQYVYA